MLIKKILRSINAVPLKYLSNFWRALEMPLINCEINLILIWSENCVISSAVGDRKFKIADTKRYLPVVTLPTQVNAKLLEQLKSGFKRTINWNKYNPKVSTEGQNRANRIFVWSFQNKDDKKVSTGYYFPKDYNIMIDGKNFFDQPVKSDIRTYDNIQRIVTVQGDDYTTGCLLNYNFFNKH